MSLFVTLIVFTEKQRFLVDKQGVTREETSTSLSLSLDFSFTAESSGHFDLDAELKDLVHRRPAGSFI